jgi:molybdopterin/thiamine biosynthesis adenylyltransferase
LRGRRRAQEVSRKDANAQRQIQAQVNREFPLASFASWREQTPSYARRGSRVRSSHMDKLSKAQLGRYARHIVLPGFGEEGQRKLLESRVLCVGIGGLGSPIVMYLAGAGVGTIGIADDDVLEIANLHRQIIHVTEDAGKPKVETARKRLRALNPDVQVKPFGERVTAENVTELVVDYDIVVDGCDNPETRYLLNDTCFFLKKPFVHGSIFRYEGRATTFTYQEETPCYRCIYPSAPPAGILPPGRNAGIAGPVPGLIGMIQVAEILKLLLGIGEPLVGRMVLYDVLKMTFREVKARQDPDCSLCGKNPTIRHGGSAESSAPD